MKTVRLTGYMYIYLIPGILQHGKAGFEHTHKIFFFLNILNLIPDLNTEHFKKINFILQLCPIKKEISTAIIHIKLLSSVFAKA